MTKSIFSRKINVFTDYYTRDLIGYNISLANIFSSSICFVIVVLPFLIAFAPGCKLFNYLLIQI